ncbi:MAG: acetylglutamate kinase [Prevotellaceae bacterium]|jgi:acetylglutamate kinase|nr:acetylglutamate kinase [Prevotellaceae bacterium]
MLNIVKIGGNVIDDEAQLAQFLSDFSAVHGFKVLVHGGGKLATKLCDALHIPTQMLDGRRVTDAETLKVVSMVYAGWISKSIVAQLYALGCHAVGLSGADGNAIPATRRSPVPVDYGFVGDVNPGRVNTKFIRSLLEQGLVPVFSAITHDAHGSLLNSNADSVASSLAIAMSELTPTRLIFCFEKNGVLRNPNDDTSAIPEITRELYEKYKACGAISGGMIPKIDSAFKAIAFGVQEVVIGHAKNLNKGGGTTIRNA